MQIFENAEHDELVVARMPRVCGHEAPGAFAVANQPRARERLAAGHLNRKCTLQ